MREFKCKFTESIIRTPNVKSFRFALETGFDFETGQFVWVNFDEENKDNKELNKILSISCCPSTGYIEVTKKISESAFSRELSSLRKGDEVLFRGPGGSLAISRLGEKNCFLVGGIGITPVFPMLEYISKEGIGKDIALLYSNWTVEDIAFKGELDAIAGRSGNIRIVHIIASDETHGHIKGFITKDVIKGSVDDYRERAFVIFGPPKMIDSMKAICAELGVEKEKIKFETFLGY